MTNERRIIEQLALVAPGFTRSYNCLNVATGIGLGPK
jgi:hypothetical protein